MKKIIFAVLVLAMLLACAAAIAEGAYVESVKGDTFLRAGAALGKKIIDVLHEGETAEYLDQKATDDRGVIWYKVSLNGKSGWVSEKYTKLHTEPKYVKASGGDSNVRSTPSLNGKSLGTLHKGESALYLGQTSTDERGVDWYKISFKDKAGWVSSKYTVLDGATPVRYVVITGSSVNVRISPSLSGKDLGTAKKGDKLQYMNETKKDDRGVDWYKVSFSGKTGWVSGKYSEFADNPSGYTTVKATEGDTNVRSTPSLSGKSLGTLHKGETASYLNETKKDDRGVKWYKISFKKQTGWVSEKYTKLQ